MLDSKIPLQVIQRRSETDGLPDGDADPEVFVIEESLGYLANRLARALARTLAGCLAPHGVSMGQWAVLLILWAQDGQSQKQLSRGVAIEEATMVRNLDRMERDGLVRRVRNPRDRREIRVHLTENGQALRDVLVPCAVAGNAEATRSLTADEHRLLLDLFRRMLGSLDASPDGDDEKRVSPTTPSLETSITEHLGSEQFGHS